MSDLNKVVLWTLIGIIIGSTIDFLLNYMGIQFHKYGFMFILGVCGGIIGIIIGTKKTNRETKKLQGEKK